MAVLWSFAFRERAAECRSSSTLASGVGWSPASAANSLAASWYFGLASSGLFLKRFRPGFDHSRASLAVAVGRGDGLVLRHGPQCHFVISVGEQRRDGQFKHGLRHVDLQIDIVVARPGASHP